VSGAKAKIKKQAEALLEWFAREARDLPWRRTRDPYAIWVSEIMLQQTQVKTVIPYWERWMKAVPDLPALVRAKPDRLHKLWEGLGYYSRVRNLQKAARQILQRHEGKFPEDFEQVLELPGIGRYTAGAICSIAFNQPRPILDGNVIRVLARVHGLKGDPKEKSLNRRLWQLAEEYVVAAPGQHGRLNESLMELGALVCLPRAPRCGVCPLRDSCVAHRGGRTAELPELPRRAPATPRWFAAFVVRKGGRFLVVRRPHHVVNGNLWEFPNVELSHPVANSGKTKTADSGRPMNGIPKRQGTAALQDALRRSGALEGAPAFGVRQSSGAFPSSSGPGHPLSWALTHLTSAAKAKISDSDSASLAAIGSLSVRPEALKLLCTIKHSITRYRITVEAFEAEAVGPSSSTTRQGRWLTLSEMQKLAFTSAHRKILRFLLSPQASKP